MTGCSEFASAFGIGGKDTAVGVGVGAGRVVALGAGVVVAAGAVVGAAAQLHQHVTQWHRAVPGGCRDCSGCRYSACLLQRGTGIVCQGSSSVSCALCSFRGGCSSHSTVSWHSRLPSVGRRTLSGRVQGAYGVHDVLREVQDIMERLSRCRLHGHTHTVSTIAWRPGGSFKGSQGPCSAAQGCTAPRAQAVPQPPALLQKARGERRNMHEPWLLFLSQATCGKRPIPLCAYEDCCKACLQMNAKHRCSRTSGVVVTRSSVCTVRHKIARQCPGQEADGCSQ